MKAVRCYGAISLPLLLVFWLGGDALADHQGSARMGKGACPRMRHMRGHGVRGGGPHISRMLHSKEKLGLSGEQVKTLQKLRSDFHKEAIRRSAEIKVAEIELKELLHQDFVNLAKVEAKVKRIGAFRVEQRLARIKTIEQAKAGLTEEQRRTFKSLPVERWGRMGPDDGRQRHGHP